MEGVEFQQLCNKVKTLDTHQLEQLAFAVYVEEQERRYAEQYAIEAAATANLVGDEAPTSYQTIRGE